jgi:hypothetical protein
MFSGLGIIIFSYDIQCCGTGSLKTVARALGKYNLDIVGVQEMRW